MKELLLVLLFVVSSAFAYQIYDVVNDTVEFTVGEIVETVCDKLPATNNKKCYKKKMKCINKDFSHGAELKNAIIDCL